MDTSVLSTRAMLAKCTLRQWAAQKTDKAITADTHARLRVTDKAGRYTKNLVREGALDGWKDVASGAYEYHKKVTSPWLDTGPRLLSVAIYPEYTTKMREFREKADDEARKIEARFPEIVEDARGLLNGAFDPSDYPSAREVRELFAIEVRLLPVPDARDWRVDMSQDEAAILRADVEHATRAAVAVALRDAYERVAEVVGRMAERLRAYKPAGGKGERAEGTFRDTLVGNVSELAQLLPVLNITSDPRLAGIAARMADLCALDAQQLRDAAPYVRAEIAEEAEKILADVSSFLA